MPLQIKKEIKGARAYLTKDAGTEEIRNSILAVINYGFYFSTGVAQSLLEVLTNHYQESEPDIELSRKQLEFLKLLASEKTYGEIASLMFISPRTVDN